MPQTRQDHLDSLRGIAAMIVVMVHFLASFLPHAIFGDQPGSTSHIPALEQLFLHPPMGLLTAGQLAVSLFFILSGYVLSWRYLGQPLGVIDALAMIAKRPIRLGGLVWFSMLVYALFWHFGWFHNTEAAAITGSHKWLSLWWQGPLDWPQFLKDLFTASFSQGTLYNNPLWTIGFELYGSLLVFAFLLLFSGFKHRLLVLLVLIGVFYNSMLVGFWVGVALADIKRHHEQVLQIFKHPLLLSLMTVLFIFLSSYPYYLSDELIETTVYGWLPSGFNFGLGYPMLASLIGFILVLSSLKIQTWLTARPLLFLGHISYAIYVMHVLVIGTFCSWLFQQIHPIIGYDWGVLVVILTGLPVCIVLSVWVTRHVDAHAIHAGRWIGHKVKGLKNRPKLNQPVRWFETHILRQTKDET